MSSLLSGLADLPRNYLACEDLGERLEHICRRTEELLGPDHVVQVDPLRYEIGAYAVPNVIAMGALICSLNGLASYGVCGILAAGEALRLSTRIWARKQIEAMDMDIARRTFTRTSDHMQCPTTPEEVIRAAGGFCGCMHSPYELRHVQGLQPDYQD